MPEKKSVKKVSKPAVKKVAAAKKSVAVKTEKTETKVLDSKKYTNMFAAWRAFWCRGFCEWAGTSSRSEYWYAVLMNWLIVLVGLIIAALLSTVLTDLFFQLVLILMGVYWIVAIIPSVSMTNRRWHDAGLSSWWWLIALVGVIPYIGNLTVSIVFFVFSLLPTKITDNPYHKYNK